MQPLDQQSEVRFISSPAAALLRGRVVIYSPPNYQHAAAFIDIAESVMFAMRQLGYACDLTYNALLPGALNILFGSNLLDAEMAAQLPDDTILYNLEQIDASSHWLQSALPSLIGRLETWDYSMRNIERIRDLFPARALYLLPIAYVPELTRIPMDVAQDIDILFYGSLSARRQYVLDQLEASGLKVVRAFNVYGAERDTLIARAKLVLNIHTYPAKVLEIVRISYLFANHKTVVSECDAETELPEGIQDALALAPYEQITQCCQHLLADTARGVALAQRGYDWICARPLARFLAPHLERLAIERPVLEPAVVPQRLHFARPLVRAADVLYLDDAAVAEVDIAYNFQEPLPLGVRLATQRFSEVKLMPDSMYEIEIGPNLSWVRDLPRFMADCARLLRPGGRLLLQVPYVHSAHAWDDPRTVRSFSFNTWQCFQDAHIRLGWPGFTLSLLDVKAKLSPTGMKQHEAGATMEQLLATLGAVDTLIVHFCKRVLRALPG